jgi:hypothetical protein
MKYFVFFLMVIPLFCSCENEGRAIDGLVGDVVSLQLNIVIVDELLNDRLNPESPAYFGEDYIQGIEILYLSNGKKLSFLEQYTHVGGGRLFFLDDVENHSPIIPPIRAMGEYQVNQGSRGNYFIDCTYAYPNLTKVNHLTTYIRYPDRSEDELMVQIWKSEKGTVISIGKLWINDDLVYEIGFSQAKEPYFNPKYFPWMKPTFDDKGNQIGEIPDFGGSLFVVLMK